MAGGVVGVGDRGLGGDVVAEGVVGGGDLLGTGEDGTEVLLIGDVGTGETPAAAGA